SSQETGGDAYGIAVWSLPDYSIAYDWSAAGTAPGARSQISTTGSSIELCKRCWGCGLLFHLLSGAPPRRADAVMDHNRSRGIWGLLSAALCWANSAKPIQAARLQLT